jgi:hypothetical protein
MNQRNQNKADDHQEEPGAIFTKMDRLPSMSLMGIDPYGSERAYIFGAPNEKGDQAESEQQRHPPGLAIGAVINPRRAGDGHHCDKEYYPHVPDKVMRKKIDINQNGQS